MPASESSYDVINMFGLFESKEAKFWRAETIQTLKIADQRFDDRKKKTIATNVLKRTLDLLKELDGLTAKEKKEIMYERIDAVAKKRRSNINQLEYDNTNWMEDAMVESYFNMYSGHFGKKLAREAVMVIYWCRTKLSETDINKLIKKSGLNKDQVFGELL